MVGIIEITLKQYSNSTSAGIYMANKINFNPLKPGLFTSVVALHPIYGYNITKGMRGDYDTADGSMSTTPTGCVISTGNNAIGNRINLVVPVVYTGEDFVKEVG